MLFSAIPTWEAWGAIGGTVLVLMLLVTSALYALFWVPATLLHRLRPLRGCRLYLSVRALPAMAVLLLVVPAGIFASVGDDGILRLGNITLWSVSIFACTLLFAVASLAALVQAWRARQWPIRRAVLIHSLLVAAACTAATVYMALGGVIGLRTWA